MDNETEQDKKTKTNNQLINIDKGHLFRLIKLLKETRQTYDKETSQGIYQRNKYKVLANFCDELLQHEGFDGLIKLLEKKIEEVERQRELTSAIQQHGEEDADKDKTSTE